MVVSLSADRRRLIRSAAEAQAWDAIVCRDAGEFLRAVFKRSVPLIVVDLPEATATGYGDLKDAAQRAHELSNALLLVAGNASDVREEIWARQLGAWVYLNECNGQRGFEYLLEEARLALERRELLSPQPGVAELMASSE
ncbi:hypothetical protein [Lacipirellula parvula]|uniref:hypothetical protein n=1 Tax=Lacipirellula parvula TaxID=2650471 RepID=UPI00126099A3|nr:hypothetical protein [Lacipirellula parvula]